MAAGSVNRMGEEEQMRPSRKSQERDVVVVIEQVRPGTARSEVFSSLDSTLPLTVCDEGLLRRQRSLNVGVLPMAAVP
jgi:hypothetical protein